MSMPMRASSSTTELKSSCARHGVSPVPQCRAKSQLEFVCMYVRTYAIRTVTIMITLREGQSGRWRLTNKS